MVPEESYPKTSFILKAGLLKVICGVLGLYVKSITGIDLDFGIDLDQMN